MDLVYFIALLIMAYFVYTLTESYKSIRNELREIRLKCIGGASSGGPSGAPIREKLTLAAPESPASPMNVMKGQVMSGLVALASKTSYAPAPAT